MLKKFTHAALALTVVAGVVGATAYEAEARRGYRAGAAIAGTVIGLGILGAYAHSRPYYGPTHYRSSCYPGRERCEVVGQTCWRNHYGERRCREKVSCYRPTVCD